MKQFFLLALILATGILKEIEDLRQLPFVR